MGDDAALREALKKVDAEFIAAVDARQPGPVQVVDLDTGKRREHFPWEVQVVTWPRTVAEITPYLYQRYRFRRGFLIDGNGMLHDFFGLVSSYAVAIGFQMPFFEALAARAVLRNDLELAMGLLRKHRPVMRREEMCDLEQVEAILGKIVDTMREEERFAQTGPWTPFVGGEGKREAQFGPESFRPHGDHGGHSTDTHLNKLVHDLALLFHDRHLEHRAEASPPQRRWTEGRTQWTDVFLFLLATRCAWHPEDQSMGFPELYRSVLGTCRDPLGWPPKILRKRAKELLQMRSRRFKQSHRLGESEFASAWLNAALREVLPPESDAGNDC